MKQSTEDLEAQVRVRKRTAAYGSKILLASLGCAMLLAEGCSYKKYFLPDTPVIDRTYRDTTSALDPQRELSLRQETPSYKNPAVEQYLKEQTPTDTLETTIIAVKTDSNKNTSPRP